MNTPRNNMEPGRAAPGIHFSSTNPANVEFLHKTRHDIRTAMHVVTGMSEVLSLSASLAANDKEAVAMLKRNAERALALIDRMFDALDQGQKPLRPARGPESFSQPVPAPREERRPGADVEEPPQPRQRALVVEDDAANALVISTFLENLKYDCDLAASGEEALQKFSAGHYDVIVMDVQMPGMDGLETTRRIRQIESEGNLPPTPILGSTGNATQDDKLFCARAGMTDYISKPFSRAQLEKKLLCALPLFGKNFC